MFLGANNGGQGKAAEDSSGVEGGFAVAPVRIGREEAVRKIEESQL